MTVGGVLGTMGVSERTSFTVSSSNAGGGEWEAGRGSVLSLDLSG